MQYYTTLQYQTVANWCQNGNILTTLADCVNGVGDNFYTVMIIMNWYPL